MKQIGYLVAAMSSPARVYCDNALGIGCAMHALAESQSVAICLMDGAFFNQRCSTRCPSNIGFLQRVKTHAAAKSQESFMARWSLKLIFTHIFAVS